MRRNSKIELASRRRLIILALLHQRPHRYNEIIAAMQQEYLSANTYVLAVDADPKKQKLQFRNDRTALRKQGCNITFDRHSQCYIWHNSPFKFSLPQQQLTALAILLNTFSNSRIIHADTIQELLSSLVNNLPDGQQKVVAEQKRVFSIDLREKTDYRSTDSNTVGRIEMALKRRQQLAFTYRSLRDGKERRHVIEPRRLYFENGHIYLRGWSIDWNKELPFRLDSIVPGSATVLPTSIVPNRPTPPLHLLRYHLSPQIARNGVSEYFADHSIEPHPDGSATITARVPDPDLFEARRILLSYGENCTILEPVELLQRMRSVTEHYNKHYLTPEV